MKRKNQRLSFYLKISKYFQLCNTCNTIVYKRLSRFFIQTSSKGALYQICSSLANMRSRVFWLVFGPRLFKNNLITCWSGRIKFFDDYCFVSIHIFCKFLYYTAHYFAQFWNANRVFLFYFIQHMPPITFPPNYE